MATMSFQDYNKFAESNKKDKPNNRKFVTYFGLRDDGDTAIVRFPYKSIDELKIISVHDVKLKPEDKYTRHVGCLRNANEPLDKCPLCLNNKPVVNRFFCKLVEYVTDDKGNIVVEAKIWDKAPGFAKQISSFINNYGDLGDMIFKIRRNGKRGDEGTRYEVLPVNMKMYDESIYKKDFSGFDNFTLFKFFIQDKSKEELNEYINTGVMPMPAKAQPKEEGKEIKDFNPTVSPVADSVTEAPVVNSQPAHVEPVRPAQPAAEPVRRISPVRESTNTTNNSGVRPVRRYEY